MIEVETHCHTVASTHAYSTVIEIAKAAHEKGLKAVAITDHGPMIPDGAHLWHFGNLRCLPPVIEGVRILHGVEANIIDYDGNIDIPEATLKELDWVIASYHNSPGTIEQHTNSYMKLCGNPYIDVIGHSGTDAFKYDYEKVIPVFKQKGKIVEINSHSFEVRAGAQENCKKIALLCKKHRVPVVVSSDAHFCFSVGDVGEALEMLSSIGFPEELILNKSAERIYRWIDNKKNALKK